MNKCKNCGHNCEGDFCFRHKERKPMPKISKKKENIEKIALEESKNFLQDTINKRNYFFFLIWQERPHKSEISGEILYNPVSTAYFHHILPKKKFPVAEFDEENIVLLTLEEHDNVEMDCFRYPEINKRREELKKKYGI